MYAQSTGIIHFLLKPIDSEILNSLFNVYPKYIKKLRIAVPYVAYTWLIRQIFHIKKADKKIIIVLPYDQFHFKFSVLVCRMCPLCTTNGKPIRNVTQFCFVARTLCGYIISRVFLVKNNQLCLRYQRVSIMSSPEPEISPAILR